MVSTVTTRGCVHRIAISEPPELCPFPQQVPETDESSDEGAGHVIPWKLLATNLCVEKEWQTLKKPLGALGVASESLFGGQICAEKLAATVKAFETHAFFLHHESSSPGFCSSVPLSGFPCS